MLCPGKEISSAKIVVTALADVTGRDGLNAPTVWAFVVGIEGVDSPPYFVSGEPTILFRAVGLGVLLVGHLGLPLHAENLFHAGRDLFLAHPLELRDAGRLGRRLGIRLGLFILHLLLVAFFFHRGLLLLDDLVGDHVEGLGDPLHEVVR